MSSVLQNKIYNGGIRMKRLVRLFRKIRMTWIKSRLKIPKHNDFRFPCDGFEVNGDPFGKKCIHRGKLWGKHLGVDFNANPGTTVHSIADGKVVYAEFHPGTKEHPNWGNIIVIAHRLSDSSVIYSLYGHLKLILVMKGMTARKEQPIGIVAEKMCPENGWWEESHIHLGISLDPEGKYLGGVLPGYDPPGEINEWADPVEFIESHKKPGPKKHLSGETQESQHPKIKSKNKKKKGKKKHKRRK